MKRRRLAGIAFLSGAILLLLVPFAIDSAFGQVTGSCTASLNGKTANEIATPERALVVHKDGQVVASGAMPTGPVAYRVAMSFGTPLGDKSWTVKEGASAGNSWSNAVNVSDYARYSTGIYRVGASSSNGRQSCTAFGFMRVVGQNALTTPVGIAATAGVAIGATTMAVAGARAARETSALAARITEESVGTGVTDFLEDQSGLSPEERERRRAKAAAERESDDARRNVVEGIDKSRNFADFVTRPLIAFAFCSVAAVFAGMATLAVIALDGFKSVFLAAPVAMINGRLAWKMRFSFMSLIGGLVTGLFLIVLFQQMGKVYPTRNTSTAMLVGGLLFGLLIPMIGRTIAVRRVNRAIERVNAAASKAPQPPSS